MATALDSLEATPPVRSGMEGRFFEDERASCIFICEWDGASWEERWNMEDISGPPPSHSWSSR